MSSVKPSHAANNCLKDELIRRTGEFWQPRLGRNLSREDARQIAESMTGYFSMLAEWSRVQLPSPANDTSTHNASESGQAHYDR